MRPRWTNWAILVIGFLVVYSFGGLLTWMFVAPPSPYRSSLFLLIPILIVVLAAGAIKTLLSWGR